MTRTRSTRAAAFAQTNAQSVTMASEQDRPIKTQPAIAPVLQTDEVPPKAPASPPPRSTKQRLVLDLLQREGGATLKELTDATGWLAHTTRASLTRLRQRGYEITRSRREDGASAYTCAGTAPGNDVQAS